jgi:enamine deaminase RidA (YjgF/YER057c/UK114 family)
LNLYVAREEIGDVVWKKLAERFPSEQRPAVSLVVTPLPQPGALISLDAVAVARPAKSLNDVTLQPQAAILPAGSRIYVSGQAEPGTLREATRKTLESLTASLAHCRRADRDVVHVKCFLQPMQSVAEVQDEIARYYGADRTPPVSFVEWKSSAPIEIEVVAWGGPANSEAQKPLEFLTPPALKASPLYSRIARIHRGGTIFLSDMYGDSQAGADEQTAASFERLELLLEKTGSDLKHLAKATYYVTDDEINKSHNAIRPKYYDPERPPAASKALVAGTGRPDVRYTMDMIAVPSSAGTPDSDPECGHGLTDNEAAAGWISLFDGATTFGWKGARAQDGLLHGGVTTTHFGNCALRGEFIGQGIVAIGGREIAVSKDKPLVLERIEGGGPIRLGEGVAVQSLAVRPLDLKPLFNGRDLAGWRTIERTRSANVASKFWRVEGDKLRAIGGPGAIEYADARFGDLVLQIDVRTRAVHSNGGVFLRSLPGQFMNGYEVQIHNRCLDCDPAKPFRYTTGGIDDRQDARRMVGRDFVAFRMTIIARGPHFATWVNGLQVADFTDDRPLHENPRQGQRLEPGALQLQAHDPATDYGVLQVLAAPL